jgi:hypothetical protein
MYRLPARHTSVYSLMHSLMDRGLEPVVASTAINLVLGELPDTPESDEPFAEWHPEPEPFAVSPEDEADYRAWCMEVDRRWHEIRMEHDGCISDRDVMVATGGVG